MTKKLCNLELQRRENSPVASMPFIDGGLADRRQLDRRRFLSAAAAASAAGMLVPAAALAGSPLGSFRAGIPAILREGSTGVGRYRDELVKDLTHLSDLSYRSQGAKWWTFNSFITPIEQFFVRSTYATPRPEFDLRVDKQHWRLKIHGNGIERPLVISYDDLLKMPSRSMVATMECAGNGRSMYWEQQGMTKGENQVKGNGWGLGAVGQAEWQFVPISHILGLVGLKPSAKWALMWSGVDGKVPGQESDVGRPLPASELVQRGDDIGLAFKMNGLDLPLDHGGPVRLVVPGWTGAASIKWLTEIKIADHGFWVPLNSFDHVFQGPSYKAPKPDPGDEFRFTKPEQITGPMVTWVKPKSLLTIPLQVTEAHALPHNYPLQLGEKPRLAAGKRAMTGFAWAPQYGVAYVEYRIDGGAWQRARVQGPNMLRYTWVRFHFDWDAKRGPLTLETRTIDLANQRQPEDQIAFNSGGYEFWGVPKFHVDVV